MAASESSLATYEPWKRPQGIKKSKKKIEELDFKRMKLKLLEQANKDSQKKIEAASRLNEIQERLVSTEEDNADMQVMLLDPAACPDDQAREYLAARKKKILSKFRESENCLQPKKNPHHASSSTPGSLSQYQSETSDEYSPGLPQPLNQSEISDGISTQRFSSEINNDPSFMDESSASDCEITINPKLDPKLLND